MNVKIIFKEEDLNEVIREIKLVLLEVDVNLLIVKDFIKEIKEKVLVIEIILILNYPTNLTIYVPADSKVMSIVFNVCGPVDK